MPDWPARPSRSSCCRRRCLRVNLQATTDSLQTDKLDERVGGQTCAGDASALIRGPGVQVRHRTEEPFCHLHGEKRPRRLRAVRPMGALLVYRRGPCPCVCTVPGVPTGPVLPRRGGETEPTPPPWRAWPHCACILPLLCWRLGWENSTPGRPPRPGSTGTLTPRRHAHASVHPDRETGIPDTRAEEPKCRDARRCMHRRCTNAGGYACTDQGGLWNPSCRGEMGASLSNPSPTEQTPPSEDACQNVLLHAICAPFNPIFLGGTVVSMHVRRQGDTHRTPTFMHDAQNL